MTELQQFDFYGKSLSIQYASSTSHSVLKREGTYDIEIHRERQREKKQRLAQTRVEQTEDMKEQLTQLWTDEPLSQVPETVESDTLYVENLTTNTDEDVLWWLFD